MSDIKTHDIMVRDFADEPVTAKTGSPVEKVLSLLVPAEHNNDQTAVVLTTSVNRPKSIIDAKPTGHCGLCGVVVYVSPSTERVTLKKFFVCDECFLHKLQEHPHLVKEVDSQFAGVLHTLVEKLQL